MAHALPGQHQKGPSIISQLAHEGQQGTVRTKQFLQQKFPGIKVYVHKNVKTFIPRQAMHVTNTQRQLTLSPFSDLRWAELREDLNELLQKKLLMIDDDYS